MCRTHLDRIAVACCALSLSIKYIDETESVLVGEVVAWFTSLQSHEYSKPYKPKPNELVQQEFQMLALMSFNMNVILPRHILNETYRLAHKQLFSVLHKIDGGVNVTNIGRYWKIYHNKVKADSQEEWSCAQNLFCDV